MDKNHQSRYWYVCFELQLPFVVPFISPGNAGVVVCGIIVYAGRDRDWWLMVWRGLEDYDSRIPSGSSRINTESRGLSIHTNITRMHSSGMHTVRLLTVSQHALCRGAVCIPACTGGISQHALGRGMYPSMHWAGCLPGVGGVCPGGVSPGSETDTPPVNRMTDRCKNITFRNYVAGGNKKEFQ